MSFPTVVINNSTGSDTTSSGAGPNTALTGVLATTHANTTVNIVDVIDLSGVATDGSAVLWVKSSSGLQFSQITAISGLSGAWVVTVTTAYANTESGKTWAIGGQRATLDNSDTRHVGTDLKAGWSIDIQQTGVNYTLTSAFIWTIPGNTVTALNKTTIFSSSVTRPLITTSTNSINLFNILSSDPIIFKHLSFSNTAGTKGSYAAGTGMGICANGSPGQGLEIIDCVFDSFVSAVMGDNSVLWLIPRVQIVGTEIKNCTDRAIGLRGQSSDWTEINCCWIHNNTGDGIRMIAVGGPLSVTRSILNSNGGRGIYFSSAAGASAGASLIFTNCDFKSNTFSGIENAANQLTFLCTDSIFISNGDCGIKFSLGYSTNAAGYIPANSLNNAFYNNASGTVNFGTEVSSITLTGDPFISSSDFGLNNVAGAGASCKKTALTIPNATTNVAGDLGAIPTGGGSASVGTTNLAF